jgi:hypothetical protein
MNHFKAFTQGARYMASRTPQQMAEMGMTQLHYDMLTSPDPWLPAEVQEMRGVLASAINISLTFANLPARALPAQYVAAVIGYMVNPVNWLTAATIAPETFDAVRSANSEEEYEVKPVRYEQMISLVMSYGGGSMSERGDMIVRDHEQHEERVQ